MGLLLPLLSVGARAAAASPSAVNSIVYLNTNRDRKARGGSNPSYDAGYDAALSTWFPPGNRWLAGFREGLEGPYAGNRAVSDRCESRGIHKGLQI